MCVALVIAVFGSTADAASLRHTIEGDPEFALFAGAMRAADAWTIVETGPGRPATLFVPTDQALWSEGSAFLLEEVLAAGGNRKRLVDAVSHHLFPGVRVAPADVADLDLVAASGTCFPVYRSGGGLRIGPEAVVIGRIEADDGVVFAIDRLLWGPWRDGGHCGE